MTTCKCCTGADLEKKERGRGLEILLGAHEILPQVQGRNLHTLTLPLGCC